jgi:outer membrane protein assembly factor BamB
MDGSGGVKWSYATGATISSSSTVADVQGDGKLEVVVSGSNKTYCLNAAGASVWNFTSAGRTRFSPAVADVDGDGRKEVVVGWSDGSVYCLNASGILKWSYQTGYEEYLSYSSVADLDGDGRPEIVFSSGGKTIYCLDGSGDLKWSHPIDASVSHPPTLANVDMDNDLEIVFGTSDGYSSGQWVNGGIVYCLNGSGVTEWTYATGDSIYNPPVVADIDLDGNPEVVVLVGSLAYCLTAFPAPQVLIPGSVAIVLVGLVSALIAMTAVTMVRRNRGVRTGSRRRRRGTAYGSRR